METVEAKPWYKSKTILFNLVVALMPLAALQFELFKPFVTPLTFAIVTAGLAAANLVLRIVSTTKVTL